MNVSMSLEYSVRFSSPKICLRSPQILDPRPIVDERTAIVGVMSGGNWCDSRQGLMEREVEE